MDELPAQRALQSSYSQAPPAPPAPWRLKGRAIVRLQTLYAEHARRFVPPVFSLVPAGPGRTLGALFVIHYTAGSTLEYHELIVMPALIRYGRHIGGWVSHIYVDNRRSAQAGRELWGLPKTMADFNWRSTAAGSYVEVSQNGQPVLTLVSKPSWLTLPTPLVAPCISQAGGRTLWFKGAGQGRVGSARCDLQIPGQRSFVGLGFTNGSCLVVEDFSMSLPGPDRLG